MRSTTKKSSKAEDIELHEYIISHNEDNLTKQGFE
jgi:hypothetical protein